MDPQFLAILRCPVTRSTLQLVPADELVQLNRRVLAGEVVNQIGQPVPRPLDAALVNLDQSLVYPVWNEIPQLVAEEAIAWKTGSGGADRPGLG
ncbi:MAG: hypothetical protein U0795_14910 [Pirellulales bacterium]